MVLPATLDPTRPLDDSFGALLIGMLVSGIVYGFCLLQAFYYSQKHAQDSWYIKTTVITIITLDTIHLLLVVISVYHYVISNFDNRNELQFLTWPILIEALFVVVTNSVIQIFYIHRIWRLSKARIAFVLMSGFILLLVVGEIAVVIVWITSAMRMQGWYELSKNSNVAIAILALSCSIDILIAITISILLHRARTGFKRSDTIINRLILFVISTGLLTAIFAIVALACLLANPYALIYKSLYLCVGHLYTNSFLATLNARPQIGDVHETEIKLSSVATRRTMASKQRDISIRFETIHEANCDRNVDNDDSDPLNGVDSHENLQPLEEDCKEMTTAV